MVSPRPPNGRRTPVPERRGGLSPGLIILVVAIILSLGYVFYAVTVRDPSQIPLLASGAVVLGIVFGAAALYALSAIWRAAGDGRGGRAILLGFVGGGAAMIAAGCVAGAIVLFLLSRS
jgi:MFS family permease